MPEMIRVAMIGCGGNARHHMTQLVKIEGVEIVGLCDPSPQAIEAAKKIEGLADVPAFDDHRAMLAAVESEAVEISTPHTQHTQQILDSLAAGRHVMCEKPLVCTVADCEKVIQARDDSGRILMTAYQRHFQAPYRYCREVIQSGKLGRVNFTSCLQSQNWFRGCVLTKTWRSQLALSGGGQLNDSGSHLLDIMMWMTGEQPAEVFAQIDNHGAEVDILTAMSCRTASGALMSFSVVGHSVNWLEDITIWLEEGTLAIRGSEVWEWRGGEERRTVPAEELGRSWSPDLNFIAALRGEEEIQTPPEEFLKVIQLTEAAWKSGATGAPAKVQY
ncbi:MAG: Gfo/Idh/MocA family oxidoreductase [Armatimonadetes bacterium]|nr:Gfo/Idh/MocA family oxidoreductase [Armatimonadota bacterium]